MTSNPEFSLTQESLSREQVLALWEIARLANEELELRPMLQRLTDRLAQRFGWELVALAMVIPEENRFECQAVTSSLPTDVTPGYSRPLGSGVVGEVAASGKAVQLDDVSQFPGFVETLGNTGSEICVPVIYEGKVIAVLNAESSRPAEFAGQLLLFEAVSEQIAGAVARGMLYETNLTRARLLETLAEVSRLVVDGRDLHTRLNDLAGYLRQRFDLVLAAILISDEDGQFWEDRALSLDDSQAPVDVEQWPIGKGIVGRAVRVGKTTFVPDVSVDPDYLDYCKGVGAELVIPLRFRHRILGAINFEARDSEQLSLATIKALEAVASQVAGAVELAVSHRRLRDSEQQLAAANKQLSDANQRLNELALVDGLTGIGNRRKFDRRLDDEWQRAVRHGETLTVALIDIDEFKAYNDALGHPAGDDCLRRVAQCLDAKVQRAGVLAARYGGEEFVLILPRRNFKSAWQLVEDARSAIGKLGIEHPNSRFAHYLTASAGMATWRPGAESSAEDLLASADRALYRAKERGRNRIEAADTSERVR